MVVFHGGPVLTMDPAAPAASAVAVRDGRIVAVGGDEVLAHHPDDDRVDLQGRTLLPGLVDAHNHLSVNALHPAWADVSGLRDRDELVAAVRRHAAADPAASWVRCHGWNEHRFGLLPTRADLDAAGVDRPVVVAHFSLHQAVVSSAALDALGIGRGTPDPAGGEILRGADGEPTGVLLERAWSDAHARSMAAFGDPDRWAEHIAARARVLHADGITAVHDAACSPAAEAVYRAMAASGTLPISVLMMPHSAALLTNELGTRLDGPPTGEGDEWCRVGHAKFFADGGVAVAVDTTIGGERITYGIVMADVEECALAASDRGFRVAVHAIGNVGVEHALATFASVAKRRGDGDHRFRVEHATLTSPAQWQQLAELGAVAVVQPGFVEHVGAQTGGVLLDDDHWLAFRGLAEAGVALAGSSDDPCGPVAPMWCAARGEHRVTTAGLSIEPDQSIPMGEWLRAYTMGAAVAGGQERERGSLTPGKRADLVVADGVRDGSQPTVCETWVAGERVYAADAAT